MGSKLIDLRDPLQKQALTELLPIATTKGKQRLEQAGEPYPGELVAPLSEYEQRGLDTLQKVLGMPMPSEERLFSAAKGELEKTLGGEEYDPIGGAYYQAYRNQVMRELQEAKDRLAARTSARDKFFGGGRIATEGELEEAAVGDLATILGQLFEAERSRRLGAVQPAMQLSALEQALPLERVQAAETLGAVPRTIEQAELDAAYNEWLRQTEELGLPLDVALALTTYQIPYLYKPSKKGGSLLSSIAPMIGLGLAGGFGATLGTGLASSLFPGMAAGAGAGIGAGAGAGTVSPGAASYFRGLIGY